MSRFAAIACFGLLVGACSAQIVPPKGENKPTPKFDHTRDAGADLAEALKIAKRANKRVILDVGGEWCGWCKLMDKFVDENPSLLALRDQGFVWLKINFSRENKNEKFLSKYPAIKGYPHLFVLDANGKLLHSQNTEELEEGKGYNLQKFTEFFKKWTAKGG